VQQNGPEIQGRDVPSRGVRPVSIHAKVRAFACEKPVHKAVAESAALSLLATKSIILPREST
jgi:hypothetical protein